MILPSMATRQLRATSVRLAKLSGNPSSARGHRCGTMAAAMIPFDELPTGQVAPENQLTLNISR